MNLKIDIKSLIILSAVFILFTVIGTISHEYGHIVVAKYYGYETSLHHASMNYYPKGYLEDKDLKAYDSLSEAYWSIDYESWPNEVREAYQNHRKKLDERYWSELKDKGLYVTIGGPVQTITTGIIGLMLLFFRKKSIRTQGFKFLDWLAVFLGLFWLRQVFNLVHSIGREIIAPDGRWFGGDEYHIAKGLNLWPGAISVILGAMGLLVSAYIIFYFVPKNLRLTLILSGFIGGISGFVLWMNILGPMILP